MPFRDNLCTPDHERQRLIAARLAERRCPKVSAVFQRVSELARPAARPLGLGAQARGFPASESVEKAGVEG